MHRRGDLPQFGGHMPGKRKLFIMHAQELAHRLVHSIAHGGLVEQFVRSYAERYNRRKLTGDPLRLRELESTIGREALLAIAVEVRRLAPRAFAQGGSGLPARRRSLSAKRSSRNSWRRLAARSIGLRPMFPAKCGRSNATSKCTGAGVTVPGGRQQAYRRKEDLVPAVRARSRIAARFFSILR